MVEEFEREYGKEAEELRQQEQEKEEKDLVKNYQGNSQQNYYMDRKEKNMKKKEKRDGMKIGVDRKISQNKKT